MSYHLHVVAFNAFIGFKLPVSLFPLLIRQLAALRRPIITFLVRLFIFQIILPTFRAFLHR